MDVFIIMCILVMTPIIAGGITFYYSQKAIEDEK